MDWYNNLKILEIDLSSYCNASCPSCARTISQDIVKLTHFDKDVWKRLWQEDLSNTKIEQLVFNGNWGDPMMHKDIINFLKYPAEHNPNMYLTIDTNGGMRNKSFWSKLGEQLAKLFNPPTMVRFGIDGTDNYTNEKYRVDVEYDKVIENAQAFIAGGGAAQWTMTVFDHNVHQIQKARQLAKEMGFVSFRSRRSYAKNIYDKQGKITATTYCYDTLPHNELFYAEELGNNYKKYLKDNNKENYIGVTFTGSIPETSHKCVWYKQRKTQIDPYMNVWPCCHISGELYPIPDYTMIDIYEDSWKKYGKQFNNLANNSLINILQSEYYSNEINNAIEQLRWKPCIKFCGVDKIKETT